MISVRRKKARPKRGEVEKHAAVSSFSRGPQSGGRLLPALAGGVVAGAFIFLAALSSGSRDRVAEARKSRGEAVKKMTEAAGVFYPPWQVLIRVFKLERELEVWARSRGEPEFRKIKTYPVCAMSGGLGPKRREGDLQVPEGIYSLNVFNPRSSFHLSLGINYPNRSDRILGDPERPGGEIFIHGECVSIGCIAIENEPIEEVYLLCLDSRNFSRQALAVHIFPCRFDQPECQKALEEEKELGRGAPELWEDLAAISAAFAQNRRLPVIQITSEGRYKIK